MFIRAFFFLASLIHFYGFLTRPRNATRNEPGGFMFTCVIHRCRGSILVDYFSYHRHNVGVGKGCVRPVRSKAIQWVVYRGEERQESGRRRGGETQSSCIIVTYKEIFIGTGYTRNVRGTERARWTLLRHIAERVVLVAQSWIHRTWSMKSVRAPLYKHNNGRDDDIVQPNRGRARTPSSSPPFRAAPRKTSAAHCIPVY